MSFISFISNIFLNTFQFKSKSKRDINNTYTINFNYNPKNFSKEFNLFFHTHFIDSTSLIRREIGISYQNLSNPEKEIAKKLIRENLHLKYNHLFIASGNLKDELALTVLYEFLYKETDLSWKLIIGQAIWKINNDKIYEDLLMELATSKDETLKYIHFEQVFDLGEENKIKFLSLMKGNDETPSERWATELLARNYISKEFPN